MSSSELYSNNTYRYLCVTLDRILSLSQGALRLPIHAWFCIIETIYYMTNLLSFSNTNVAHVGLRLCSSLLIFSLSARNGFSNKPQTHVYPASQKTWSENHVITLFSLILFLYELGFLENTNWTYLRQEDREILIMDFLLECFWRFIILNFTDAGYLPKLFQIVLSCRLVSIASHNHWHFPLRARFLCGGILVGLSKSGFDKLKKMHVDKVIPDICDSGKVEDKRENMTYAENSKGIFRSMECCNIEETVCEKLQTTGTSNKERDTIPVRRNNRTTTLETTLINNSQQRIKKSFNMSPLALANVLQYLPEGVIILDLLDNIKFMNNYMLSIFELDLKGKISLKELSQYFSEFKFQEASLQLSESLSIFRTASGDSSSVPNVNKKAGQEPLMKPDSAEFLKKIKKITSLEDLVKLCIKEPVTKEIVQQYIPTFQTRYHQASTDEWFSIEIKLQLLPEDEKYIVILLRDITERENKLISLEKEKTLYRDNLIASFSHELRTPLNANLAFLEQSMDSPEIPAHIKKNLLKPALDSGRILFSMVSDILDYSLLILNKFRLEVRPQNIIQTVNRCLELFSIKASQKNVKIKLTLEGRIPPVVYTDHKRVSQVLTNLLSNAVQFTTEGEVEVLISAQREQVIMIAVSDTGIGMKKDAQERLKRTLLNHTLKEKLSEASAGVGLGLFISNKLAKLLGPGGENGVRFSSEYMKGSKFYFEIENMQPMTISEREIELTPRRLLGGETDEKCDISNRIKEYHSYNMKNTFSRIEKKNSNEYQVKALIVDDEIFNITVIENYCKSFGIATEKAFNGKEALLKLGEDAWKSRSIRIVFMDINMPVMDGYESTKAILKMIERDEIDNLVVIGVTAYVSRDIIDKCYECGMTEVLNKPLSKEGLMGIFKKYSILK